MSIFDNFLSEVSNFSILEIIGVISSLLYIYFATKENRLCFLFGLISSTIYVYICFSYQLYFDTLINLYYIVMSFVGWAMWSENKNKVEEKVKSIQNKTFLLYATIGGLATLVFGGIALNYSDASLPFVDSFTTVFAIIATVMVVKKQIENWLIWIIVDGVGIGMYFYKELYFTSFLFLIYTIIAIQGYRKWKTQLI
ncbi:nicotinamide mononucleotide transporter [bacterium]|nr:nicotinamide mononucleotide transporter [bacterium]